MTPEHNPSVASEIGDLVAGRRGIMFRLATVGFRSQYAYLAAFGSIGLSLTSWLVSRSKTGDDKSQSDRWGIFIGHWAPTFMALGIALKLEEDGVDLYAPMPDPDTAEV